MGSSKTSQAQGEGPPNPTHYFETFHASFEKIKGGFCVLQFSPDDPTTVSLKK